MSTTVGPENTAPDAAASRSEAHIAAGKEHLASDRWPEAIRAFLEAESVDPKSFWGPHLAGIALERMRAWEDAIPCFERALVNATSDLQRRYARNSLQGIHARCQRFEAALAHADAMLALDPNDEEARRIRDGVAARVRPVPVPSGPAASPPSRGRVVTGQARQSFDPRRLPLPPTSLRHGGESDDAHLEQGRRSCHRMIDHLDAAGFRWSTCGDVLDFGCGVAMRTRWLAPHAATRSVWGVDTDETRIAWVLSALCPPLRVARITDTPHLPFRDGALGLVDASRSFHRLGLSHTGWLLEFARTIARGGFLYLEAYDERAVETVLRQGLATLPEGFDMTAIDHASFTVSDETGHPIDFHAERYLLDRTRGHFELRAIHPGTDDPITAYVFERT